MFSIFTVIQHRRVFIARNIEPIYTLDSEDPGELNDCGAMNIICEECGTRRFKGESPPEKKFTQCCRKCKVIIRLQIGISCTPRSFEDFYSAVPSSNLGLIHSSQSR